ncbi:MAG: hypothetical protein LBS48_03820 [Treponema sp.]|jgi:hypothetical protein|nr:hypothetical protein [Treponema sp.]
MHNYTDNVKLALDTLDRRPTVGIPTAFVHIMEHQVIERLACCRDGEYSRDPHGVYIKMQQNIGACMLDQYLADNPLSMGGHGYEHGSNSPTTGLTAVLDGITIDSPEAVAEHLETYEFSRLREKIKSFYAPDVKRKIANQMSWQAQILGENILSTGYGHFAFPALMYGQYGYVPFLESYAIYPELWEQHFRLQGEYAALHNRAVAELYLQNEYPLFQRLDHDMADSRSTLVSIASLEKMWLPHFLASIAPALDAGFKLIWHCDGNLSALVPILIEAGLAGFQGFQYEDGMDYEKICAMRTRDGETLIIEAGVSVTRTLPFGTPADVVREMKFLVEHGPKTGLFLAASSSCTPGTPWKNIKTFVEGLQYYRINGRVGL